MIADSAKYRKEIGGRNMNKDTLYDYIVASVTLINLTEDVDERERLFDKLHNLLKVEGIADADWYEYDGDYVYNCYINWDSNCGFSFIEVRENFEELMGYANPEDLKSDFGFDIINDLFWQDGEREEYWTDFFYDDNNEDHYFRFNEDLKPETIAEMLISLLQENKGEEDFRTDAENYFNLKPNKENLNVSTKASLYDKMCKILTEYEEFVNGNDEYGNIYDQSSYLYRMLVEIQNNWESIITAKGE